MERDRDMEFLEDLRIYDAQMPKESETKVEIKTLELDLYSDWACYLMYGDHSGLEDQDIEQCDAIVKDIVERCGSAHVIKVEDLGYKGYGDRSCNLGGDYSRYTFQVDHYDED